jgi:phosphatidylglycerophosphatase A
MQKLNSGRTLAKKIGWGYMLVTTGCFSGYSPIAPGTAGTVVAIPLYLVLLGMLRIPQSEWVGWILYIIAAVGLFVIGMYGADRIELVTQQKDHGIIVVDEIVGYLVTMFLLPQQWLFIILGFFVFRFFDIWKPYPIRRLDKNPNLKGFGVMIDDVLAGVYGNIVLHIVAKVMDYAS